MIIIIGLAIWRQYNPKLNTSSDIQNAQGHAEKVKVLENKRQKDRDSVDAIPADSLASAIERAYSRPNSYEKHSSK